MVNEGRRKLFGKIIGDVAKYATTLLLGAVLLKPDTLTHSLAIRGGFLTLLLLFLAWFIYPKGKE